MSKRLRWSGKFPELTHLNRIQESTLLLKIQTTQPCRESLGLRHEGSTSKAVITAKKKEKAEGAVPPGTKSPFLGKTSTKLLNCVLISKTKKTLSLRNFYCRLWTDTVQHNLTH